MPIPLLIPVTIAGLGSYLPARRVTNNQLADCLGVSADWIERASGVCERHYANSSETTVSMAAAAVSAALEQARLPVSALDAIIGASAGPQQAIPCTAALVQRELQAPEGQSICFDINATCVSFLLALQVAAQGIVAGLYRTVAIFSSEISSRSLNWQDPESSMLFGDAAAAAILRASTPAESGAIWHSAFATHSSGADYTTIRGGGTLHHPNDPATTPEMNTFHMEGPALLKQSARLLVPFLDRFFAQVGWERQEVDVIVPHQASNNGLNLLTRRLGFKPHQIVRNLEQRGNCVSASIPLAFSEAVANGAIQRKQRIVLIGTGAGLTLGAIALTF